MHKKIKTCTSVVYKVTVCETESQNKNCNNNNKKINPDIYFSNCRNIYTQ